MSPPAAQPIRFFESPSRVLVTGGTGFIGRHLVAALLADGHSVTVLTRRPALAARRLGPRVRVVAALDDIAATAAFDAVVNLAGARILGWRWTAARKAALLQSRVAFTERLVDWIGRRPSRPRILLSASAIGYYGVQPQGDATALQEDSPPQPVFMSELCRRWEQAAARAAVHGVRVACLRFALVLGHGGALPMLLLPVRLGLAGRLGSGRQWFSWIHIDDLLAALAHALRRAEAAPFVAYNAAAPEQVSQLEFSRTAAAVLGRPCIVPTPAWPLRLALGEQADLLLEGQRVQPARLLREGFVFRYPTLEAALRQICRR